MPNLVYLAFLMAEFNAFIQTGNAQKAAFIDISYVSPLPMPAECKKFTSSLSQKTFSNISWTFVFDSFPAG